ncbi:cell adhesion molecule CEACAM5-like [Symphorus nematophorus]
MDLFACKSLLFLLFFIGCCAGQDILPEGPVDAILGRNVTLTTLIGNNDFDFVIWNFNDGKEQIHIATQTTSSLKVNAPYEGRVSINKTNGYLTLGPLKSEDSGDYSINVLSDSGATKTGEIKLRVLEPVSDVAIMSSLREAIEHNDTVVLTCSAKGSYLKFTWTNGTAPIVADGTRITLKEEELSSALTITGVLRTDLVGPIVCTAANKLETEKSAPFNLTVYYGPDDVTISPPNPPPVLRTGANFSLTCASDSSPAATYTWYHSGEQMEIGGPVLTLNRIQEHGLGKEAEDYTCRATNAKTKRVVPSPAVSLSVMDPITGVKISGPTEVLIAGNSSANISCMAAAGTVKETVWLKDGKALSASDRLVIADDKSSIMIKMLQKEDNGVYECDLINPVNEEKASYTMVVNYGPEAVKVEGKDAVEIHDPVKLTCSAASVPPANFTWKFNGTLTDVKTAVYSMDDVAFRKSGTYTCIAHNTVTGKTTSASHILAVAEEGTLDDAEGLSDGAIAGIVIGVLIALGLAIGLILYCRQKVPVESPY